MGKNLAVNLLYTNWDSDFPTADCNFIRSYGGVPMLTWEPFLAVASTLETISSGELDLYITNFARAARSWNNLVYLRFAHEMNGSWYPWSGLHNGNETAPAKYIAAWRHIYGIFASEGATNVKFVWSPNHASTPPLAWNEAVNYYPGSSYVDWIAIDGYNWGESEEGSWQTFDQIFLSPYTTFSTYGKPMMIGEFACTPDEALNTKSAWITDAFTKIRTNYPLIKIFCWFNMNKERDWRVTSSPSAQSAYITALGNAYFSGTVPTY